MAYPGSANQNNQLKLRTISADTSSTGGRPVQVTVPFRAKYLSTQVSLSGEATQSTAGAIDIFFFAGALASTGAAVTSVVITSGAAVTTSTGNATQTVLASTVNPQAYFSAGDTLVVSGSTLVAYNVTHILQEF